MGSMGLQNLYYDLPQDLQDYISRLSLEALPQNLQDYISGLNLEAPPLFVAQKLLNILDVDQTHNRLCLPKRLINAEFLDNFLTKDDKEQLDWTIHLQLNLVDNMMHEYDTLCMTKWDMKSSPLYLLASGWNDVVLQNKLKTVDVLKDSQVGRKVGMVDGNKLVTDVVARVWCFGRNQQYGWHSISKP